MFIRNSNLSIATKIKLMYNKCCFDLQIPVIVLCESENWILGWNNVYYKLIPKNQQNPPKSNDIEQSSETFNNWKWTGYYFTYCKGSSVIF